MVPHGVKLFAGTSVQCRECVPLRSRAGEAETEPDPDPVARVVGRGRPGAIFLSVFGLGTRTAGCSVGACFKIEEKFASRKGVI